jgi:hypothetical protein
MQTGLAKNAPLRSIVLYYGYGTDKNRDAPIFATATSCPQCRCEYVFTIDDSAPRTHQCQHCTFIFKETTLVMPA